MKQLNKDGRLHVVPAKVKQSYVIRFTVTSYYTTKQDIERDWQIIQSVSKQILDTIHEETMIKRKFQSSLLLSNVPQTPKLILHNAANTLVNASFLAFFNESDIVYDLVKELSTRDYSQSHLPLIPRRKPKFSNNPNIKGVSFDQLNLNSLNGGNRVDNGNYGEAKNMSNSEFCLNKSSGTGTDQKSNEEAGRFVSSNGMFLSVNGHGLGSSKKNIATTLSKQSSLDSKIEHICEEVEEAEIQANNNNNADIQLNASH